MAKVRSIEKKKKINGIVKLKIAVEKLQKSLSLSKKSSNSLCDEVGESSYVPEDVKEGHMAVIAVDGDGAKRFVIPISCLTHPAILRLLEQAAEEFGFEHKGALTVPCKPSELERIFG